MISLNNVNKYYNRGKSNEIHVINDANITLPESGIVAIFGRSGCGKTTLLNAIGGLDNFQSGDILIDNQSIKENPDEIRNKNVGYIFQNYNLNKNETCLENVVDALRLCGMTDEKEMRARAITALKNVDMDKFINRLPSTLSGGQQQRIAIARAIVKNPRIILADEPTGNLDEANTVKIMDLLKAFSKDHLVLLVTHEANLVDFYCDTVIELSDGKIVGMKTNENANGYKIKSDRDIYLGELSRASITSSKANITYYGEAPAVPLEISIVNYKGKTYLKVNSDKVQILDSGSEVKLHEGSFEDAVQREKEMDSVVLNELPPVQTAGKKTGNLFTFMSSLKSAFKTHFGKVKKGNRFLRVIMVLFSIVLVFMTAVTGTSIKSLLNINRNYAEKVFYLYVDTPELYQELMAGVKDGSAHIDQMQRCTSDIAYTEEDVYISTPKMASYTFKPFNFESFDVNDVLTYDLTNQIFTASFYTLSTEFCKDATLLAGTKESKNKNELVISKMVADELLENSPFGFIDSYDDLIGMTCQAKSICGIVDINEPYAYVDASFIFSNTISSDYRILLASDYGITLQEGEVILWTAELDVPADSLLVLPAKDETVVLAGNSLKVAEVQNKSFSIPKPDYSDELAVLEAQIEVLESKKIWSDEDDELYNSLQEQFSSLCYQQDVELEIWYRASEEYYGDNTFYTFGEYGFLLSDEDMQKLTYSVGASDYCVYSRIWLEKNGYYELIDTIDNHDTDVKTIIEEAFSSTYLLLHSNDVSATEKFLSKLVSGNETFTVKLTGWGASGTEDYDRLITPSENRKDVLLTSMLSAIGSLIALLIVFALLSVCIYFVMRSNFFEHMKEVGIYRAIGVSKKNIRFRYFVENSFIIGVTVFIGYLITSLVVGGWLAKGAVGAYLYYPLWLAIVLCVVLYGVCLFCGMLPVWGLLKKTPSQILAKYDI